MFKINILLAIKILLRRKFYTFISLFCISLTLMVLILVTSVIDNFIHPRGPENNSNEFLVVNKLMMVDEVRGGRSVGALGYRFIENNILNMQTPTLISVFSVSPSNVVGFKNNIKLGSSMRRTDANYWKILNFDFIEGRGISEEESRNGTFVLVISETTKNHYFPNEEAIGNNIELGGLSYRVVGVVKDVSPLQIYAQADIWMPIFATASTLFRSEDNGSFAVLMQGGSEQNLTRIKDEYQSVMQNYQAEPPAYWRSNGDVVGYSQALSKMEQVIQQVNSMIGDDHGQSIMTNNNDVGKIIIILSVASLLFMTLPVINLVNINISRILERSSEIGVRKSFGASSSHLVRQFIIENLVITGIGGMLGFVLSVFVLYLATLSGLFPSGSIVFNLNIFFIGLFFILIFGLFSGVYPAWKMSRMDPVQALKGAV